MINRLFKKYYCIHFQVKMCGIDYFLLVLFYYFNQIRRILFEDYRWGFYKRIKNEKFTIQHICIWYI